MSFSCVYSIQCKDKEVKEFYIGSTKTYCFRYRHHKSHCINKNTRKYTGPLYQFIRQNGGWDNWEMIVEVKTDDLTKEDREILEQVYKDLLQPHLNSKNVIGIDKEKEKKTNQEYYEKNKEKIAQRKNIKGICPQCGKEMLERSIKRHIKRKH